MFEFKKLCDTFEKLSTLERRQLLVEKSHSVFNELQIHAAPDIDPKEILAGFMIGSVMADGKLNEMEYLLMYPSLVQTFGDDFDFQSLKVAFRRNRDGKKMVGDYVDQVMNILKTSGEKLKRDVIILCLCTTSIDGKITLKEKRYLRRLCETAEVDDSNSLIDFPEQSTLTKRTAYPTEKYELQSSDTIGKDETLTE